jgi:two-component system, NarL family, response regulator LiaR
MNKIKILLADDHALFREGTRSVIEQEPDMEVVGETGNGAETIKLAAELHPNVILIDIAMPQVNGSDITRRIKADYPATMILILTDDDNDQYIVSQLEAGAAGYLLKNINGADLVNAIHAVYTGEAVLHPSIA